MRRMRGEEMRPIRGSVMRRVRDEEMRRWTDSVRVIFAGVSSARVAACVAAAGMFAAMFIAATAARAQNASEVTPFVSVNAPVFVLAHVRVVDGTGAAAKDDQSVVIANGKIQAIGPAASVQTPAGAQVLDRTGYTVIPGIVGMHNHLYYTDSYADQVGPAGIEQPGLVIVEVPYTGPRLYLAAGVTTMRTTGSLEPYTDIKIKQRIDSNQMPGPSMDLTAPYLEGAPTPFAQMHELTGPDDARRLVDYWAAEGMTSFKAYMNITRDELAAAIQQAHAHQFQADWAPLLRHLAGSHRHGH